MWKDFLAGLYSVSLLLLLCISGCLVPRSGGMSHLSPKNIVCGQPWVISAVFYIVPSDPKERYGKLTERYKDVTIHIRDSVNSDFVAVPMVVESANPAKGEIQYLANMKATPCDSGIEYVEYYIDKTFKGIYNRSKYYTVPVSKK